jgi:NTP pyrophosphatase (non-canonical NTP hydrolase)
MKKLQGNMRMNKYEQFDISMSRLKEIEKELSDLINKDNPPLGKVMLLREEATHHYKICNDTLKDLKDNSNQSNEQ